MFNFRDLLVIAVSIALFTSCTPEDNELLENLTIEKLSESQKEPYGNTLLWSYQNAAINSSENAEATKKWQVVFFDKNQKKLLVATNIGIDASDLNINDLYEVSYLDTDNSNPIKEIQAIASIHFRGENLIVLLGGHVYMVLFDILDEAGALLPNGDMSLSVSLIENAEDKNGKHILFKDLKSRTVEEKTDKYMAVEIGGKITYVSSDRKLPPNDKNVKQRFDVPVMLKGTRVVATSNDGATYVYDSIKVLNGGGADDIRLEVNEDSNGTPIFSETRYTDGMMAGFKRISLEPSKK